MKKLMITLSAAALAFGAFADGTEPIAVETFNAASTPEGLITSPGESSISETAYSFSQKDTAGLPNGAQGQGYQPGNNLSVKTKLTEPAYYSLDSAQEMDGVYFDSLVKFTACDEDAVVPTNSNAKLMVWVKEIEGETPSYRLFVTAGQIDANGVPQACSYDCGLLSNYNTDANGDWCRLTIKSFAAIKKDNTCPGFRVFVNGKPAQHEASQSIGLAADVLTKVAALMNNDCSLFPSLVTSYTIQGVGFAGQGGVDDIVFTKVAPKASGLTNNDFTADPIPAIATVGGVDAISIEDLNAKIAAAAGGAAVVLVDNVTGDIAFEKAAAYTLDLGAFTLNGKVTVKGGSGCTLTISGTTGKIEDEVTMDEDEVITLASGKIKNSTNPDLKENVSPAAGLEFVDCDEGAYTTVALPQEDGSEEKPYTISNAADFSKFANGVGSAGAGKNFKLMKDITVENGTVWSPIGKDANKDNVSTAAAKDTYISTAFQGVFDGQGYTISGVVLPRADYTGVFGSTYGATIRNLNVVCSGFDSTTETANYGGAILVGTSVDTTIENCSVSGEVTATKAIAGLVGYGCSGTVVKGCVNKATLSSANEKVGGIIACAQKGSGEFGDVGVTVDGCTNEGNLTCTTAGKTFLGGLVSYADSKVTFKGENKVAGTLTQVDGSVSSIAAPNGGTIVLENATFTVPAGYVTTIKQGKAVDGMFFAVVEDNVATLVKAASLDKTGKTQYKVMAEGAAVSLALNDSIDLDETLKKATVSAADAANNKVTKSDTVYTCVAKSVITSVTLATAEVEYGTTVAPVATVKDADGKEIVAANYDLSYSSELTATTAVGTEITVTATAKGDDYVGSASAKFTVVAKAITVGVTINGKTADEATWSASLQLPTPVITGVDDLTADTDYDAGWVAGPILPETNPDKDIVFTYTVTLKGNYSGTASATFTVKPAAGGDIPTDPEKDITDDTKPTDLGLDAEGPFKDAGKAELIKLSKWANKAGKKAADINTDVAFDNAGNPTTTMAEAYLLDCGVDGVAAAKEAFKFNADDLAAVMADPTSLTTLNDNSYNGTIQIKAFADAACKTPAEGDLDAKFYKAVLVK